MSSRTSAQIPPFRARLIQGVEWDKLREETWRLKSESPRKVFYTPVLLLETVCLDRSGVINTDSFLPEMAGFMQPSSLFALFTPRITFQERHHQHLFLSHISHQPHCGSELDSASKSDLRNISQLNRIICRDMTLMVVFVKQPLE